MGLMESKGIVEQRREKFEHMFRNNYKPHSSVKHEIFGQISLFENKNSKRIEIMMKEFSFNQQSENSKLTDTLEERILYPEPNLLNIYSIDSRKENGMCGNYESIKIYAEFLDRSLKSELRKRRRTKIYHFSEEQRRCEFMQFGRF